MRSLSLIVLTIAMAQPTLAEEPCLDDDTLAVLDMIVERIGAPNRNAGDWIARQMMEPEILVATVNKDPALAAMLKVYDRSKLFASGPYFLKECEPEFSPSAAAMLSGN